MMNAYVVEFLGTLLLTFVVLTTGNWLAVGSALAIAVLLSTDISSGSFNPAVTLALAFDGRVSQNEVLRTITAQVAGAIAAVGVLRMLRP